MKKKHILAIFVVLLLLFGCSDNGIFNPQVDEDEDRLSVPTDRRLYSGGSKND